VLASARLLELRDVLGVQMVERERFVHGRLGQFESIGDSRRGELAPVVQHTDASNGDPTATDMWRGLDLLSEMLALGDALLLVPCGTH
jgi:hypothetical protein